jgi:hypothetical protein
MTPTWAFLPPEWRETLNRERRKMTVCIAATCDFNTGEPKAILCADWQVMSELGSAQTAFKQLVLSRGWHCLYSGHPHAARTIQYSLFRRIIAHKGNIDETNIKRIIQDTLNQRKRI